MANTYCENKSNKPVITRYDPSENYVVQMVESLSSIDYPNENHIYVIESTGEKYIYYNGAFSKFEYDGLEPLVVTFNATYSSSGTSVYQYYYSDHVTYDKTYDEVKQAVEEGRPIYLKNYNDIYVPSIKIENNQIYFSTNSVHRFQNNTQFETENRSFVMPKTGTYGTSTRIRMYVHNLGHSPLKIDVTASNVTSTGHQYYTVWSSSNVTFSKTYTEIYNALRNGVPMVVTYDGLTKECIALQIDSSTIALSVCDAFLDTVPKPRYRTETFTIKSDNTGSYVKTLLSMNGLDILIGNQ